MERRLTSSTPRKPLWTLAVAALFALAQTADAAPARSGRQPAAKPAPKAAAKPAAKRPAKSQARQTAKPKPRSAPQVAVPMPPLRPGAAAAFASEPPAQSGHMIGGMPAPQAAPAPAATAPSPARPARPAGPALSAIDLAAIKRALDHVRAKRISEGTAVAKAIGDENARKLVEWAILRSDDGNQPISRYTSFISANPHWPSIVTLRRKAEAVLYQERVDPATTRAFFTKDNPPLSAKGSLALARALLAQGDRNGATAAVRDTWRQDAMSADVESRVISEFGELLTKADHKVRMDRRLYEADDTEAGIRAAGRLGGHEPAIARARTALITMKGGSALLDKVPAAARDDIGYKFARAQMLRRANRLKEAVQLMATIPNPLGAGHDRDQWWVERRLLARELMDEKDFKNAYIVARDATTPSRDNYRAEHQFTAGWIAMRFLNDPKTAYEHFRKVGEGQTNPISVARGFYWMGRAAEAMNRRQEAQGHYQAAARHPTTYYGQIARAKAGLPEIGINAPPAISAAERARASRLDIVRVAEILYAIEARDLVAPFMADLGDKLDDLPALVLLSEIAARQEDPRGMLLVGKLALARGHALDHAAFPTVGLPRYTPIGPEVEPALVYSIARQESWFNPRTVSSAKAMGYMQVTPAAGKYLAKKFKVPYDQNRLLNDAVYNMQMGAAELGDVIQDYRGSYILAFVAYNAGRGRVRDWISRFGDPRDPKIDPIDWVERIPFAETRNYVQRVMENVQVYRARFGGTPKLLIEADLRRGAKTN